MYSLLTCARAVLFCSDEDIIRWANEKVRAAGKSSSMANFKDPSLRDARFFLDLLEAVRPKTVDYQLVTDGVAGAPSPLLHMLAPHLSLSLLHDSFAVPLVLTRRTQTRMPS